MMRQALSVGVGAIALLVWQADARAQPADADAPTDAVPTAKVAGDADKPPQPAGKIAKVATAGEAGAKDSGVMRYPPSSVRQGLILGGSAITGAAYGLSVMSSRLWQDVPGADALLIPIAGPWISLAQNECSADKPDCGAILYIRGALLVLDGLAQLGGLGLIGEGIFMTTEADPVATSKPKPKTAWTIAPVVSPTHTGVSLVGTF